MNMTEQNIKDLMYENILKRTHQIDMQAESYLFGGDSVLGAVPLDDIQKIYDLISKEEERITLASSHLVVVIFDENNRFVTWDKVFCMLQSCETRSAPYNYYRRYHFDWLEKLKKWENDFICIGSWMKNNAHPSHQRMFSELRKSLIDDWRNAVAKGWCNSHHKNLPAFWSDNGKNLIIELKFTE
jgi:hypothetical protein